MNSRFTLPERYEDQDDEQYASSAAASIMSQVEVMRANKEDGIDQTEHDIEVFEQLRKFTESQDPNIAFHILFDATQINDVGEKAKAEIVSAYENETFVRSQFMVSPTFDCVIEQVKQSSFTGTKFLTNPKWLLVWFEKASAADICRLIHKYFHKGSSYRQSIKDKYEEEIRKNSIPGFATICFCLINVVELSDTDTVYLLDAFNNPEVYSIGFKRVLTSAKARMRLSASFVPDDKERNAHTLQSIRAASGCFINTPYLSLTGANFQGLDISGAIFYQSNLIENNFQQCTAAFARFDRCTLTGTDFSSRSDLSNASFIRATLRNVNFATTILRDVDFSYATLSGVDFSEADFTGATFTECKLSEQENIFINRSDIRTGKHIDAFNRLSDKIRYHAFKAELRGAIADDLIMYCTACLRQKDNPLIQHEEALAADKAMLILREAYEHPLFSDHRHLKFVMDTVNVVSDTVSSLVSWSATRIGLYAKPEEKNVVARKQLETDAQVDIRLAIGFLNQFEKRLIEDDQINLATLPQGRNRGRPKPPTKPPAYIPGPSQYNNK